MIEKVHFWGELQSVVRTLKDVTTLVQDKPLVVWMDSEGVLQRLTGSHTDLKKMMDSRVSRLMSWLLESFPSTQLSVYFNPG